MPIFENVEVSVTTDIEFEVYCGTCGAGLCGESETRRSSRRGYLQVTVNACPTCMAQKDQEREEEVERLQRRIEELENEVG